MGLAVGYPNPDGDVRICRSDPSRALGRVSLRKFQDTPEQKEIWPDVLGRA
jgi:hypothetical protein